MEAHRIRRRYDHRLQRLVHDTGDIGLAVRNGVPRSTARDWSRLPAKDVVTLDVTGMSESALQAETLKLQQRNAKLLAVLRILIALLTVTEATLARRRVSDRDKKRRVLRAVERSRGRLPSRRSVITQSTSRRLSMAHR